jgi:NadR type nicotinamide-nucleotide adenylyltransferase
MFNKIVIIGPESTGKSTLCKQLAAHYKTNWCPEYARKYLLTHGKKYGYDDLLTIAKGQIALENESIAMTNVSGSRLLFIDTDMYVMKVWCEFVFGKCHRYIPDQIAERKYDLYFLCNTDLPWVKDELREYPDIHTRQKLYHIYKEIMISQPVPWIEISGNNEERLLKAIAEVNMLLKI